MVGGFVTRKLLQGSVPTVRDFIGAVGIRLAVSRKPFNGELVTRNAFW